MNTLKRAAAAGASLGRSTAPDPSGECLPKALTRQLFTPLPEPLPSDAGHEAA